MNTLRSSLIRLAHSQPTLRPHLLPLLTQKQAAGKIPVNTQAIRSALYKASDGAGALETAVKKTPATKNDKTLASAVEDLQKALDAVEKALNPYTWD